MYTTDFLEPLKRPAQTKKFCVFDIESKHDDTQEKGFTRPFLVGTYDPNSGEYVEFRNLPHLARRAWDERHVAPGGCVDRFLNYLLSSKTFVGYNVYAHNGGSFDFLFLLAWFVAHRDEFDFEIVPVQSSIQILRVWRKPQFEGGKVTDTWTFLDSMKLLPMGLEKACKSFGLEGKVDHDLDKHEDHPEWSTYLEQDCRALAEVMIRTHHLIENVLGGEVGVTTPATSMKLFRRKYLGRNGTPAKIRRFAHFRECAKPKTCPGCCHAWIRQGYYGGRTELFGTYGENLHYYDFNSSYVASMLEGMPAGERIVTDHLDWKKHEHYAGFAEVTVRIPRDCYIPPLPHRMRNGKLGFPTGVFSGVWSCEELALLSDPMVRGEILHVKKVVWFRKFPIFADMMRELYKLRDKSLATFDEGLSLLAKLLGNGLYGKFGMRQERTKVVFARENVQPNECFLCGKEKSPSLFMCKECEGSKAASPDPECPVWYQEQRVDAPYILPQIAAHITALARVRLWNAMKAAIEAGGRILYADSVTGDRTTVIRSPRGIEVLTFEELWSRAEKTTVDRGKEFSTLPGYEALTEQGWKPLTRILRHRSGKATYRVSTKHGQTQVTGDHGIMVRGRKTTPLEFIENQAKFERVGVPEAKPFERLDLFDYVKDWTLTRELSLPQRTETFRFETRGEWIILPTYWGAQRDQSPLKIRRFYRRGSEELHSLLRLIATYVCDGSASIVGQTTDTRFMLGFCKQHLSTVERVRDDLLTISPDAIITGPLWSDTTYVIRAGCIPLACLFAALCGTKSKNKALPSFVYELDEEAFEHVQQAFIEGDAPLDAAQRPILTTTSQKLAAGYSLLLAQRGIEHGFSFRESKKAWTIRTRPVGSERKRYTIKSETFEGQSNEWVYDLTVDSTHTFVDGIGQVLLHNTDSILTTALLESSTKLGALKDEYPGTLLRGAFVQPKVYMLESDTWQKAKVTMKGFPPKMRTKENLALLLQGETLEWTRLEKVRTLAQRGFEDGPKMVKVSKSFKSKYDKREVLENGDTRALELFEIPTWMLDDIAAAE